ncbi:hypothetical protein G6F23_014058 [Rhizopus arrhizus]|nr:hypothetical protein G6F23_014058 [Rhizopus arrhizus]
MGQCGQRPPLAAPQRLITHLVPHLAGRVGQQQALFNQARQHRRGGIGRWLAPAVRAEFAQQLALLGIHRQWLVQMGGQGHPADLAVHLGVAGQHRAQVQGDRLAGSSDRSAANFSDERAMALNGRLSRPIRDIPPTEDPHEHPSPPFRRRRQHPAGPPDRQRRLPHPLHRFAG